MSKNNSCGSALDFSVPSGLNEMLQEFVVQCLIEKPDDLVGYAADYFAKLKSQKAAAGGGVLGKGHRVGDDVGATGVSSPPVVTTRRGSDNDNEAQNNNNNDITTTSTRNGAAIVNNGEVTSMAERRAVSSSDEEEAAPPVRMPARRRRQAVAAETYDPTKEDASPAEKVVHPKTDMQKATLREVMKDILLFRACEPEQIHELLDAMFVRSVDVEETVIRQGDDGDNFYVIETGKYGVFVDIGQAEPKKVHTFLNSGSFGELALMYNCPRNATIVAETKGIIWALDQAVFRRIVVGAAARKRRAYEALLQGVPMLAELREYERTNLADALESVSFGDGECVIRQGDDADCMYFVEAGFIRIVLEKDGDSKVVSVLQKGDYFGEMALVMNQPRSASVYAKGQAKCARLDVGAFERLLGPCMEIMKRNIENYDMNKKALGLE